MSETGAETVNVSTKANEVQGYAKVCGILSLIAAIISFLVPMVGVLFIVPIAIILGALALYGGYKGVGIATIVIVSVNLIVSPTFWANIGAGAKFSGASGNRFLTYFDVIGVAAMIYLAARKT